MGEEKRNKIVAAITVNAILLVFIIVAVLIAQIVQISVLKRRKNALTNEYYEIVKELENSEKDLDRLQTDERYREWIIQYIQMGYSLDDLRKQ